MSTILGRNRNDTEGGAPVTDPSFTKPIMVHCSAANQWSQSTPLEIIGRYAQRQITITDRDAQVVKRLPLKALAHWWQQPTSMESRTAAHSGRVVHWPVRRAEAEPALLDTIQAVDAQLGRCCEATQSLLDRYPYSQVPEYAWMIFGPQHTTVECHQDMLHTASWNLLCHGRKLWEFWPPETRCPKTTVPALSFRQQPEDLIWIPEGWWHQVQYETPAICFSKNLVLTRSLEQVTHEASQRDQRLCAVLQAIANTERKKRHASH